MISSAAGEQKGPAKFGFTIKPTERGWRWAAFDLLGRCAANGEAATRAEAAAHVIRALART